MPYSLFDEMKKLKEEMENMFKRFDQPKGLTKFKRPVSDIWETKKEVKARVEMPGIEKKDIKLHVTETSIEIKAERKEEKEKKKKGMHKYESSYSGFYRYLTLPEYIDAKQVSAEFKNGILTITAPKVKTKKKREIEIK